MKKFKETLKRNIEKVVFLFFLSPILFNFLINIFKNELPEFSFNFFDVISSFLIFIFLFNFGLLIKKINKDITITFGIITYLFSFFILENIILFFLQNINLNLIFITTNIFWLLFFVKNFKLLRNLKYLFLSFSLQYIFNSIFINKFTVNKNVVDDVETVFLPYTTSIYENGFYYSILNPIMNGYPQFMSYLDSIIFKISFNLSSYSFYMPTSLLYFWLYILLFFEIDKKKKIYHISISFFIIFVFNSSWISFLFLTSLMSERIASYLFLGTFHSFFNYKNKDYNLMIIGIIFGFNFFTKQFFSILFIFALIFIILFSQNKYKILFAFIPILIFSTSKLFHFSNLQQDSRVQEIDFLDTFYDLIYLRDLNLNNFSKILVNLYNDKPAFYIMCLTLLFSFIIILFSKCNFIYLSYISFVILNFVFVIILYISVWRNMELDSPIRFILSTLPINLIIISFGINILINKVMKKI